MFELAIVLVVTASVIGLAGKLPDPRKVKRELATAHIAPIKSLSDGSAAVIRGSTAPVKPGDLETSPLTDSPCLYWIAVFEELGTGGDSRELGRARGGFAFLVADETATARVVPDTARIAVPPAERIFDMSFFLPTPLTALTRKFCRPMNYPNLSKLRVTEYAVRADMIVTVKGWCTHEPDPDAVDDVTGYREDPPMRTVISGTRRHPLLIG